MSTMDKSLELHFQLYLILGFCNRNFSLPVLSACKLKICSKLSTRGGALNYTESSVVQGKKGFCFVILFFALDWAKTAQTAFRGLN